MKRTLCILLSLLGLFSVISCTQAFPQKGEPPETLYAGITLAPDIEARVAQFARTEIDYDRSLLDENETQVVQKLIEASQSIDEIFWLQVSEKNPALRAELVAMYAGSVSKSTASGDEDRFPLYQPASTGDPERDALEKALGPPSWLTYFDIMKGPWDRLKEDDPFVISAGPRPPGAAFYPTDITKQEVEDWIAAHPGDKASIQGLFSVIERDGTRLVTVPYSKKYRPQLENAALHLREAAAMTNNASLRTYLTKLAEAFFTDDYFESDVAWMDLDSSIEVVIGPYEVYEDELFNYKASFESFVCVVDKDESEKLKVYAKHLPEMERNLPIPDEHKNPNRGGDSPIRVVQEIYTAGDARRGVMTSAFNLPNDEKVREAKGSKKVLLKNVMEAKYQKSGNPIVQRVLEPSQASLVNFDAYFNHILFHELSHGLGPGIITTATGEKADTRLLLKEAYSAIEECKADVVGVYNIEYAMNAGLLTSFNRQQLYGTYTGMMYRSMRFGVDAAHGRGNAVQWNWHREKGAIVPVADGRFHVDFDKIAGSMKELATELLMIEATGDYARAQALLEKYGTSNAEIEGVIARLVDLPVDIAPVFIAAGEK